MGAAGLSVREAVNQGSRQRAQDALTEMAGEDMCEGAETPGRGNRHTGPKTTVHLAWG